MYMYIYVYIIWYVYMYIYKYMHVYVYIYIFSANVENDLADAVGGDERGRGGTRQGCTRNTLCLTSQNTELMYIESLYKLPEH